MSETLVSHNFRSYLQEQLVERCRRNPRYSLRSFAKSMDISPSALSDMLNGKRTITGKSIEKLGLLMGLTSEEIVEFKKSQADAPMIDSKADYRQISVDQYSLISDWYHYAIIELLKVKNFSPDASWIAKSLGITKSEANIAIERLMRMGLIASTEEGGLIDTSSGFSTNISSTLTSQGSRKLQKQILEQSIEALMNVPVTERNHTSMTMAIDPKSMPEAIKRITKFRRELCEYLESQGNPTEIYQLALSLFPVTQITKHEPGENV